MKNFRNAIIRFLLQLRRPSKRKNIRRLKQRGEILDAFIIREATSDDIPALSALHVKTWNETYRVKNPPAYQVRENQWRQQFKVKDDSWFCYVVENTKGELIGFAKGMSYTATELPGYSGELNKIYLLREYQRLGLGRRLVGHVARKFLDKGIFSMVLFGIPQNPSCYFHEAIGGKKLYSKKGGFHGGYGWQDLQRLAIVCPAE